MYAQFNSVTIDKYRTFNKTFLRFSFQLKDFLFLIFNFQFHFGNIHKSLKRCNCLLAAVDRVELGFGEFEFREFGHVNTFTAAVLLRQFVQLLLHLVLDFWCWVDQLAAAKTK